MPINTYTPGFNQQQDQSRQAQSLQELLGKQLMQNQAGEQRLADIAAQGGQARQTQTLKDSQEQEREQRSQAGVRQFLGMGEGDQLPQGTGVSLSAGGGAAVTRGFNPLQIERQHQQQTSKEAQALGKLGAPIAQAEDLLDHNNRFQKALDLGSEAGDKTAAIEAARLGEGMKARIQQAVIEHFMKSGASAEQATASAQNWMDGQSGSTLPPAARNNLRDLGRMHYDEANRAFTTTLSQAMQQAPLVAPGMAATGALNTFTNGWGKRGNMAIEDLNKRFAQQQQEGGRMPGQTVQQYQPSQQGLKGFLSGVWNGRLPPQNVGSQVGAPGANTQSYDGSTPLPPGATQDMQSTRLQYLQRKAGG